MKVGLSNHQPVCVCVRVCVSPTNDFWNDQWNFREIW